MRTRSILPKHHVLYMVSVLLSIVFLASSTLSNNTSALTYQSEVTTEFTFNPTLSINLSSSNIIINDLAPGSASDSNIVTVGVTTNTAYGYILSATAGIKGGNTNLVNTSDSTYKFTNLATTAGAASSLNNIPNDKWGYSYSSDSGSTWVSGDTGSTATGYAGLPLDDNDNANERGKGGTTLISTDNPADSKSIQFKIGAKASTSQPAGTYTNVINFYAVTNPEPIVYDMQNMADDDCIASTPSTVRDVRDGEQYLVQRLADGNCWLLDNLRLDPTSVSLTDLQGNTNASSQTLTYFKNGGGSSPYSATGVNTTWASSSDSKYDEPKVVTTYKDTTTTSYGAGSGKIGVYYNYCAASAGSYCYPSSSSTGDATEDLCPAGWRMPTGGSSGEYQALYTAYNSDATAFKNALSTPLSGSFGNGSALFQDDGYFWSSTRSNVSRMYYLDVDSGRVNPTNNSNYRSVGVSMRCVKKSDPLYMQDVTSSMLDELIPDEGDNVDLVDKRDGETYKVARLADGEVWMLDNLRLDPTTVDLTKLQTLSNASATTIVYLKNGGGSSPYPATGVNTTWASSSDNKYDEPKVVTTYKDTTATSYGAGSGKIGVYYNYCAASAGSYCYPSSGSTGNATEDLCPAGWRMPTGGASGEYQALYTAYSSDVTNFKNALSTPLSGNFADGSANGQGLYGGFWSSTRSGDVSMYNLRVASIEVSPSNRSSRPYGYSMRCLLDS